MSMSTQALAMIERDAETAPAPMIDHHIEVVRNALAGSSQEVQEHAHALLLKLERLARDQRTEPAATNPQYLAPWLTIAGADRAAA